MVWLGEISHEIFLVHLVLMEVAMTEVLHWRVWPPDPCQACSWSPWCSPSRWRGSCTGSPGCVPDPGDCGNYELPAASPARRRRRGPGTISNEVRIRTKPAGPGAARRARPRAPATVGNRWSAPAPPPTPRRRRRRSGSGEPRRQGRVLPNQAQGVGQRVEQPLAGILTVPTTAASCRFTSRASRLT